jgi:hypothetical protein
MAFQIETELRDVKGISVDQKALIKAYLQGSVYSWIKNRKGEQFAVRNLVGGENTDWAGTPLQVLYDKHADGGKDDNDAVEAAAKDVGWLLKTVLDQDKRTFSLGKSGLVNAYCWVENEQ